MIGSLLNDRYRIDAELGRGGMGAVYRAHDTVLDRDVAVKLLSESGLGTEGRERMLREAQAIAQLNHPNIVQVFDAGQLDETPYIVMELVEGQSLQERPPKDFPEIVTVGGNICAALEHAHQHGIIHRDLKPENVLIGPDGTAKLMDFGIARSVASRMTTEGEIVGTVFYLAPEIALGQDFDGRADLYSLGVMLYELTTGELPFALGDPLAVISQHIHASVVPPRAKNEKVPPRLDDLILQLMEKSPGNRPQSAGEARKALERSDLLDPHAEGVKEIAVIRRMTRGRFVGREQELTEAVSLWNRTLAGQGQLLLVSGEPGIGKTRLIRELSTHVEVTGGRSLIGECESEGGAPYAPFAQIIRRTLRQGAENGFELPEFVLGDLLELTPELKPYYPQVSPNPRLEPEAEQRRLFEHMVTFCRALSEQAPLLLVIDDAHWADSGSLSLLRYLAGRTQNQRTLLAATYREVELDEARPFHEALLELNRKRLGTRLKLKRFDQQQASSLLAAIFEEEITPEFLQGIYEETEGNPFFIEEVCKALVESGQVFHTENGWDRLSMEELEIPQSVRVAIQSRVSKLPEAYQDALNLAAILGREFDFDTLAAASELDEDTLIEALETAEQAQLIEEVSGVGGATFSFVHALIPTTLAEGVRTLRRRRLHKRAAEAIEHTRPHDLEDLAHHYEESGDEERARSYYARAGERASAAYANQEAKEHFQAALDLHPSQVERADLLSAMAEATARLSRLEDAIQSWQEAAELYGALDQKHRVAWCYTRMARSRWYAGDTAGALELSTRGLQLTAGAPESGELAGLIHETARAHQFLGDSEEALTLCRQALQMARRVADRKVEADTLITLGIIPSLSTEEAISVLEQAIEIGHREKLLTEESRAHNNLGVVVGRNLADFRQARPHYLQAAEIARQIGDLSAELYCYNNAIFVTILSGDLAQAERMLASGREIYAQLMDPGAAGENYRAEVNHLEHAKGYLDHAAAGRRDLLRQAAEAGSDFDVAGHGPSLGLILIELREYDQAVVVLDEALVSADRAKWLRHFVRSLMATALAGRGQPEQAKVCLAQAEAVLAERPEAWPQLIHHWSRANVLAAGGHWEEAFRTYEEAAEGFAEKGLRPDHARTLSDWAEAHLARGEAGDTDRARQLLREALAVYHGMGADGYVDRVNARLAELGN
jgi:tetratricopeptide (TPR) repeat protein